MEFLAFAAVMLGAAAILGLLAIVAVKLLTRGAKSAAGEAGSLFTQAEQAAEDFRRDRITVLTHGQKIGKVIDATDSLGTLLTTGGYMAAAEWLPLADKITTAVAQAKHPAVVSTEAA